MCQNYFYVYELVKDSSQPIPKKNQQLLGSYKQPSLLVMFLFLFIFFIFFQIDQAEIGRHMIGDREWEVYRVLLDEGDGSTVPKNRIEEAVWKMLMGWE